MRGLSGRRILLGLAAPVGALITSLVITTLVLLVTGHNPWTAFDAMFSAFGRVEIIVGSVNLAFTYYLAAVAVAIGFKMNLFNIGVDGQYRLAAMLAAAFAGAAFMSSLPGFLRVLMTLVVAMLVGAIWAGIAGWLKVTRGVSEVITTIMLNAIATAVIAYLIQPSKLGVLTGNNVGTPVITEGGQVPTINIPINGGASTVPLYTMGLLSIVVGILYWLLLSRTVFGFSLRATGLSETAAVASGVNVKRMVMYTMLISGAVAGLTGMPELLNGLSANYSLNFPTGIGFTGIAIALLGRNSPVGIAFAALLWAFLDNSSNSLQGVNVPKELVTIMQGVIVFSVVIAYELVRRYRIVLEQRDVARALSVSKPAEVAA
jgi:simple sugar transport system permease protein